MSRHTYEPVTGGGSARAAAGSAADPGSETVPAAPSGTANGRPDADPGGSTRSRFQAGRQPPGHVGDGAHAPADGGEPRETGDRRALLRLLAVVAAVVAVATIAGVGKTVAIVLALVLMVMLHELGHFLTAKRAGMKVTEYFLGFGPRLWSIRRGETEYGVKALPFGGYVKILGMNNLEEVDPADEPRTYRQKPYLSRLSVAVAGSAMHFLLAVVLLFSFFFITGQPGQPTFQIASLYRLSTGPSPAQEAGFQVGDRIVSVDGRTFANTGDQGDYIRSRPGQRLDVVVDRHGQLIHLFPTPIDLSKAKVEGTDIGPVPTAPTGFIGIGYHQPLVRYGLLTSLNKTGGAFVDISARTFDALGNLVTAHGVRSYGQMLLSQKAADSSNATTRFVSPVGFVRIANQAARNGASDVISILVLFNIFIGIFNLLPLLPLDGGHVAVATYEAIRSRKGRAYHADVTKLMPLTYAVFLVLVFIGVSALFLDVRDLLSVVRF